MSSEIDTLKLEMQPFIKRSITTLVGNVPGTTLVDATLVEAANFWNGCWVLLRTGAYAGQLRRVVGFATPTITLDHTVGGQILAGIHYTLMTRIPVDIIAGGGLKADLRQVLGQGADIAPGNELLTEDTGLNTNPRRYEKDNGFRSAVVARAGGVATALWTIGTVPARTAGQVTTVYTLMIENATGAAVTGWLEIGGVAVTVPFHVANNDSVVIDFPAGLDIGNNDVNCNASANGVIFQIVGTEA